MTPGSWNYLLRVAHFYGQLITTKWAEYDLGAKLLPVRLALPFPPRRSFAR